MDIQAFIAENESVWIAFKRDFHTNTAKLLHDILCLSNSHYDGDRFIIFGVKNDKTIYGIEADPNRKTNADLHDFLRQANLNKIPQIELTFYELEGHEIGLLHIKNQAFKPYFVRKDFTKDKFCVRGGVVYTRLADTNIPSNETAPNLVSFGRITKNFLIPALRKSLPERILLKFDKAVALINNSFYRIVSENLPLYSYGLVIKFLIWYEKGFE